MYQGKDKFKIKLPLERFSYNITHFLEVMYDTY
jgi:hypothetical protein